MSGDAKEQEHVEAAGPYRFYVHNTAPAWRLVRLDGARVPPGFVDVDWQFTRERAADDTNVDIRRQCQAKGFCLFKIGGTFAEVAAEVDAAARRDCGV